MKCSDCGQDWCDTDNLEGSCARAGGHILRCSCQRVYGAGIIFPAGYLGLARSRDCPIHTIKDTKP